jgi:hypothetical protein
VHRKEQYRRIAEQCLQLAQDADPTTKAALLEMARNCTRLAESESSSSSPRPAASASSPKSF